MCCIKENNTKIQFVFVFSLFVFGRAITWHPSQEVHVYVWEGVCVQCHLCMYACFVYMSMHLELLILCLYICSDCEQKKTFCLGLPQTDNKVWFDLSFDNHVNSVCKAISLNCTGSAASDISFLLPPSSFRHYLDCLGSTIVTLHSLISLAACSVSSEKLRTMLFALYCTIRRLIMSHHLCTISFSCQFRLALNSR